MIAMEEVDAGNLADKVSPNMEGEKTREKGWKALQHESKGRRKRRSGPIQAQNERKKPV